MKKTIGLLVCAMVVSTMLYAQPKTEKEVAVAVESLKKAMTDGNRQELEAIAAPQLSYGHSSGLVEDKATFVEHIASGRSDFVNIEFLNQAISLSGNTALVRHRLKGTTNDGGVAGTVDLGILLVFQKQNGKWLLLARQAYK